MLFAAGEGGRAMLASFVILLAQGPYACLAQKYARQQPRNNHAATMQCSPHCLFYCLALSRWLMPDT